MEIHSLPSDRLAGGRARRAVGWLAYCRAGARLFISSGPRENSGHGDNSRTHLVREILDSSKAALSFSLHRRKYRCKFMLSAWNFPSKIRRREYLASTAQSRESPSSFSRLVFTCTENFFAAVKLS